MILDEKNEMKFLEEYERGHHCGGIGAKQRFIEFLKVKKKLPLFEQILDVGGTIAAVSWFKEKYPDATITVLNSSHDEIEGCSPYINDNAEAFCLGEKFDMVFAGEILEHTYNPDGLIASSLLSLKLSGYLVITTPDLACLFNIIFLLFGWTPENYSPPLRFLTGNPFFGSRYNDFGYIADHKSVFTRKALVELLKLYRFEIYNLGYSYGLAEPLQTVEERRIRTVAGRTRLFLNRIIPGNLREGMLIIGRPPSFI